MRRIGFLILGIWLVCGVALATGLDDLQSALEKLRAKETLRARITHEISSQSKEDGELRTRQSRASAVAEDGGPGKVLQVTYEDSLIAEASKEQSLGRQDVAGPAAALSSLSALLICDHLRAAEKLLEALKGAELLKEVPEKREGRPIRKLELKLAPPPGADKEKRLKISCTGSVWVDEAGVPLELELRIHAEIKILIFKAKVDATEKSLFAVAAGRLVKSRHESDQKANATIAGDSSERTVTTVEPL